jgi:2-polyprenyl-6-methoxyphenol hydroxylase-like FAD-dependent oxidoreductase
MVGAYVLASELASHIGDLAAGVAAYERELRAYVLRNQDIALELNAEKDNEEGSIPDFGALTLPFALERYLEVYDHLEEARS